MSPRRRLVPALLAGAATAAVLLAGCSSSGGTTASAATGSATSSAPAAATSSAGGAADPAAAKSSAGGATDPVTGTSPGSKVFAEPTECGSIAQKYGSISSAMLPVLQGKTGPTPFDADQMVQAVSADIMGTIPAELTPDFAAFGTAAEQLRGKDLTAAAALLNGPQVSKATANIEKFLSDHC